MQRYATQWSTFIQYTVRNLVNECYWYDYNGLPKVDHDIDWKLKETVVHFLSLPKNLIAGECACVMAIFCFFLCSFSWLKWACTRVVWLPGKATDQDDRLYVKWNIKPYCPCVNVTSWSEYCRLLILLNVTCGHVCNVMYGAFCGLY